MFMLHCTVLYSTVPSLCLKQKMQNNLLWLQSNSSKRERPVSKRKLSASKIDLIAQYCKHENLQ